MSLGALPDPRLLPPAPPALLAALRAGVPTLWMRPGPASEAPPQAPSREDIEAAGQRMRCHAPLLQRLFPELAEAGGIVESALLAPAGLQAALGLPPEAGTLLVKADHALPVAGSVKARGGLHELLEQAEALARAHGLGADRDVLRLAEAPARQLFARHEIAVGSTGNLGLAIGLIASALGFRSVVHMSSEAKAWKKERLRQHGVTVREHAGDYAEAVAAGRRAAAADPRAHFVDDERSRSLLLGYATAARHLAAQLEQLGRRVDERHPLFVHLPCGVGGAPAGIALGLHRVYGAQVHCLFAEPVASPCLLLGMLAGTPEGPGLEALPSVRALGLDNRTVADGLAVPRASALALEVVRPFLAGVVTVDDDTLLRQLWLAHASAGLRLEPSAAAGFSGPARLVGSEAGRAYLARQGLVPHLARSTHVVWTTGGLFMPEAEHRDHLAQGEALEEAWRKR